MVITMKSRAITKTEENALYDLLDDKVYGYRVKIVLLSRQGYKNTEVGRMVNRHPNTVHKWIEVFKRYGIKGLTRRRENNSFPKFDKPTRKKIVSITKTDPRKLGMPFSTWSLRNLKIYLEKRGIVDSIGRETIRTILLCNGISWKKHREILTSSDPEYELKKKRVLKLYKNKPKDGVVLCQDEKGPIAAKELG